VIDFHVSEDALSVMIPRLVLQPILENSVFHGLERKPGKGQIQVEVFTQAGMLMMRVQDNGLGMQAEQLQELLRRVDVTRLSPDDMAQDKKGIGLWNIARRLYLFYQDRARLTFESVPQQGTRVEIQLPV
ncbi:MAG: sensor histidine kinase, partial [Aristaeellaceae bacterium]